MTDWALAATSSIVNDLLSQLVRIQSVNPSLDATGSGEAALCAFVADWLERAKLEVFVTEPAPGRPNVIGLARGSGGGRSLLLNAHMDTACVGTIDPSLSHTLDGRAVGPGCYDMKAGLAIIMCAAAWARQMNLRGDVLLAAVSDEEHQSLGARAFVNDWQADAAIVAEGTSLGLGVAHHGVILYEIPVNQAVGEPADASLAATAAVRRIVAGLMVLNSILSKRVRHPRLGSGRFQVKLSEQQESTSDCPSAPRTVLMAKRLTVPGENPEFLFTALYRVVEAVMASDPRCSVSVRQVALREAFHVSPEEEIVRVLSQQAAIQMGVEARLVTTTGWTDAAVFTSAGIPTVIFGPTGGAAHTPLEWVDLESMQTCLRIIMATLKAYCC